MSRQDSQLSELQPLLSRSSGTGKEQGVNTPTPFLPPFSFPLMPLLPKPMWKSELKEAQVKQFRGARVLGQGQGRKEQGMRGERRQTENNQPKTQVNHDSHKQNISISLVFSRRTYHAMFAKAPNLAFVSW